MGTLEYVIVSKTAESDQIHFCANGDSGSFVIGESGEQANHHIAKEKASKTTSLSRPKKHTCMLAESKPKSPTLLLKAWGPRPLRLNHKPEFAGY